jgi:hypothetical protein
MTYTITLLFAFLIFLSPASATECEVAYLDATYGYQHAETAMEANNIEQLKQYALRSKTAIEKVLRSTEKCGCEAANSSSYDALENLNKALDKDSFERVRLFVNRAKTNAKDVIIALDKCSANDPSFALKETEGNLLAQEKLLQEQQNKLIEQQKKLEAQIKEQQRLQEELKMEKEVMLATQQQVRKASEQTLKDLESIIIDFTKTMGCEDVEPLTEEPYVRTMEQLELETLKATKIFYAEKAKEMASSLLNRLSSCEWKIEK